MAPVAVPRFEVDAAATQKPNEVIDVVFWSNSAPLGPLQHEIYNHMLGWAQLELRNQPPDPDVAPEDIKNLFELKLSEIAGLCGYGRDRQKGEGGSKNLLHFCQASLGLRDRSVVYAGLQSLREDGYNLIADDVTEPAKPTRRRQPSAGANEEAGTGRFYQLVSSVEYDVARDSFTYELPKRLCARLLEADETTQLESLVLPFSSRAATVLWELYLRHRSEKQLPKRSWKIWSRLLRAERKPHDHIRDFNKMLRRALQQVNDYIKEHELVPKYEKAGRVVDELSIEILPRPQQTLPLEVRTAQVDMIERMKKAGVRSTTAHMYVRTHGVDRCRRNMDYAYSYQRKYGGSLPGRIINAINNDHAQRGPKPVSVIAGGPSERAGASKPGVPDSKPSIAPVANRREADAVYESLIGVAGIKAAPSIPLKQWVEQLDSNERGVLLDRFYREADSSQRDFMKAAGDAMDKPAAVHVMAKFVERIVEATGALPALTSGQAGAK